MPGFKRTSFVWLVLLLFIIIEKHTHKTRGLPIRCSVLFFLGVSLWGSIPVEGSSDTLTDETAYLETAQPSCKALKRGRAREGEIPTCTGVSCELVTLVRRGCVQNQSLVDQGCLWCNFMVYCGSLLAGDALGPAGFTPHKIQSGNYFYKWAISLTREKKTRTRQDRKRR